MSNKIYKNRYINTKFWNDPMVSNLQPLEKLLFIYFLTNEHTNIAGIYELPIKIISVETGLEELVIGGILLKLSGKIRYLNNFVVIKNFVKHQKTNNRKIREGILNILKELDPELLETILRQNLYILPQHYVDELSMTHPSLIYGSSLPSLQVKDILEKSVIDSSSMSHPSLSNNSNSNSNSNSNVNSNLEKTETKKETFGEFNNVFLKGEEYQKLVDRVGEANTKLIIEELSTYVASKGKRYKNHYATLLGWARRRVQEYRDKTLLPKKTRTIV